MALCTQPLSYQSKRFPSFSPVKRKTGFLLCLDGTFPSCACYLVRGRLLEANSNFQIIVFTKTVKLQALQKEMQHFLVLLGFSLPPT